MSEVKELERFAAHDQHLANRLFGRQNAHLKQIEQAIVQAYERAATSSP